MKPRILPLALLALTLPYDVGCSSCRRAPLPEPEGKPATSTSNAIVIRPASAAGDSGAPRPGMAWIPPGVLRAGTPVDRAPRVADEELAGVSIPMNGFYMDVLPHPNEPGAIPTSGVSRDEAEQLCTTKGKRLCTELEWERACKGPDNTTYEYGDLYRASACGTGVAADESARRPLGEHVPCKSAFGVADLHGSVWEWTDSPWARTSRSASLGVLRGGNAVAGELVGRCANAIGRKIGSRAPSMGLRCCAGPRNEASVSLVVKGSPDLQPVRTPEELHDVWEPTLRTALGTAANHFRRAWRWSPVPNEELVLILGCNTVGSPTCALAVGRSLESGPMLIASADIGLASAVPDVARVGDARHLRLRGLDPGGTFGRDITYVYGRIEIGGVSRP